MKKYLCLGIVVLLLACNNAGDDGEKDARTNDTVIINADSVKDARTDGTDIDATVLDTTVRQ